MDADREYFESLVADALDELPEEFARRMENVAVVVEEEPEGPLLGLYHGMPRARLWRQMLSDSARLRHNRPELILEALDAVEELERV